MPPPDKRQGEHRKILADGVRLGKVSEEKARQSLANLLTCSDLTEAASGANWLVETVSEQLAVKKAVLAQAAPLLAPDAIIATNTSALSVTEIAASVECADRVIGMHFFNPVHKMKLVELVRGWLPVMRSWRARVPCASRLAKPRSSSMSHQD